MQAQLTDKLTVHSFGSGNSRILLFRHQNADPNNIEQIPGTQALLIGGTIAKRELYNAFTTISRAKFQELVPDGISGGTQTTIRAWLGMPQDRGRPRKAEEAN